MALPSIMLLLAFVGGVAATMIGALVDDVDPDWIATAPTQLGRDRRHRAGDRSARRWLHWRRFMVPITVAAGAVAVVGVAIGAVLRG